MSCFKSILLLFLVLFSASETIASCEDVVQVSEEFTEALLLRPLPDRKVLAHFHFQSTAPPSRTYGRHHHLFPKSIYQLVHKFKVREMELSFTQGRWNYERWGGYDPISNSNAKPPGVELWADFDVPQHQVEDSWKNLTHALSGLFCASINFLEQSTSYSALQWSFQSLSGKLRYGTLPREAVCTENLTPWLKLLPCRDKAGLSSLMDRPSIYRSYYHSQRLHLRSDEFDTSKTSTGIVLEQTLTVVLQPNTFSGKISQPSWSLSSLFGRKVSGKCSLSNSSNVYVQFEQSLVSKVKELREKRESSKNEILIHEGFQNNLCLNYHFPQKNYKRSGEPEERGLVLYEFSVEDYDESEPFDLGLSWKVPVFWSCQQAPLHASRFLLGSGNERGAIAISMKSTENNVEKAGHDDKECWLRVGIFQVVPWYVKVYYHTLEVFLDGEPQHTMDNIAKIHVSPSEDKVSPGVMEIVLRLPCSVSTAALTLEFDKGFLHIDEYPPDANQGFDIPSAVVRFNDFVNNISFDDNSLKRVPILSKLEFLSYTEVLLVPLTTPDFSMPYNVITITCTVFALYFGSLLNALRTCRRGRKASEGKRQLDIVVAAKKMGPLTLMLSKLSAKLRRKQWEPPKPSSSQKSVINYKLILKVLLVAGVAVAWQSWEFQSFALLPLKVYSLLYPWIQLDQVLPLLTFFVHQELTVPILALLPLKAFETTVYCFCTLQSMPT
ncbi:GPI transamidase component PIG-T [Sesamum angolense]|uniref:GPI transamidase component PIG-T n=1 Tax=Sesamum angolense TaxID=2727404 RepID=A0AAE1XD25_9LAMI|nr:GPI transamidase component PIG-T [Sesamum angolense]